MATAALEPPSPLTLADLAGDRRRMARERRVRGSLFLAASLSLLISAGIVLSLVFEAWTFISKVEFAALWSTGWFPRQGIYDLKTPIIGSFIIGVISMLIAAPIGLGSAIYLSEYANPRVRRVLKPILEILAGIPSVVLGFFALTFISPDIVQRLNGQAPVGNLFAAGIGVGILIIPLIASISEDALRSVPDTLREASYGMGAKKVTTALRVVVPAAVSGIVAAFIIGISRAIGETMVVTIAAGGGNQSVFTANPFDSGTALTAAMASQAKGTDNVVGAGLTFQSLFFLGMILFIFTLLLNLVADRFVRKVRQAY